MTFHEWAYSAGLTHAQVRSFEEVFGMYREPLDPGPGDSETAIEKRVQVRMSQLGGRLWKNHKGAAELRDGRWIRYGILNQTKEISDEVKSSDLIGLRPVLITPAMVGTRIGQFCCREVKRGDWTYTGDAHELGQVKFMTLVLALGGDAGFIQSESEL